MKFVYSSISLVILLILHFSVNAQQSKKFLRPEPAGWFTGDMHVHRNCGDDSVRSVGKLTQMMEANDIEVIAVLADMGNGEVKYSDEDLKKVTGKPAAESGAKRIVNWDVEWHWDATYSQFAKQALGGHLVLLGLKQAKQIWEESPYKILDWGKKQNAVAGFAHMQYLNDSVQTNLNCCIPIDYPVEAALGTINFISEDVFGTISSNNGNYFADGAIKAYYKLLNCGFRMPLVAGTDYPCNNNEPLGTLLTYVNIPGKKLTYKNWVEGIREGKTVVSRNAHNEFLDLKVNGIKRPGDIINFDKAGKLNIVVNWSTNQELSGSVEILLNGEVVGKTEGNASAGRPVTLRLDTTINRSGWIAARRMSSSGHTVHTSACYVTVDNKPVRASAADADYFIDWISNVLKNIQPGADWNKYFPNTIDIVTERYQRALEIFRKIKAEVDFTPRRKV